VPAPIFTLHSTRITGVLPTCLCRGGRGLVLLLALMLGRIRAAQEGAHVRLAPARCDVHQVCDAILLHDKAVPLFAILMGRSGRCRRTWRLHIAGLAGFPPKSQKTYSTVGKLSSALRQEGDGSRWQAEA